LRPVTSTVVDSGALLLSPVDLGFYQRLSRIDSQRDTCGDQQRGCDLTWTQYGKELTITSYSSKRSARSSSALASRPCYDPCLSTRRIGWIDEALNVVDPILLRAVRIAKGSEVRLCSLFLGSSPFHLLRTVLGQ